MARGRRAEAWTHTSWLLAMLANAHRDARRRPRPYTPEEFNPYAVRRTATAEDWQMVRETLEAGRRPPQK